MVVWHVTTLSRLTGYLQHGMILPPVRAWCSITAAERFSKQTGRHIILRLKFPPNVEMLAGHRGEAVVLGVPYRFKDI